MFYIAFMKLTSKSTPHPINKKPRLESIKLHSGYEPHAAASILNWLEEDWASNHPTNKKTHECGLLFFIA